MGTAKNRLETVLAALLYLITAYRRSPCPCLAACIARHFRCLAQDPRADRLVGGVAAASIAEWEAASRETPTTALAMAGFSRFALQ